MAMETQTIPTTSCRPINEAAKKVKFILINELSKTNWENIGAVCLSAIIQGCVVTVNWTWNSILYITKDKIILKSMIKFLTYWNSNRDTDSGRS